MFKKWTAGWLVLALGFGQLIMAPTVSANSLEGIREQQEETESEINSLEGELNQALEEVSEVSVSLNELNEEIEVKEATIEETEEEVVEQEAIVEERMEQARGQLQALQRNEVNQNVIITLLESESLTDLFNRALAVIQLTDAGAQAIELAQDEYDVLVELQEQLAVAYEELEGNVAEAAEQKDALDTQVAEIREMIEENQVELTELTEREKEEVARVEAERERQREEAERAAREREEQERAEQEAQQAREREARAEAEQSSVSTSSSSEDSSSQASNDSSAEGSEPASEQPQEASSSNQGGRSMTVQATGYSTQEANLSTHTATGIDLRQNPRVIAVDPSVIPLGSMVEVEGMGVYIAGDTGGAIQGNIIDIHFPTVREALNWGRRSVNIRVLD